MDIEQLYRDFNVDYVTEGHKHSHPGWVHTPCPFCTGNSGYHLGYDTNDDKFVCWRCGWHKHSEAIAGVLRVSNKEAYSLLKQYGVLISKQAEKRIKVKVKSLKLPKFTTELQENHKQYLIGRNFDPEKLVKTWGLLGTGVHAPLDKLNYKHRIIIPYFWNDEMVSFDSRDITGKAENKYQASPVDREVIEHKKIIYGKQSKWGNTLICVEGTTDVWRLGVNSGCTSGIKYTPAQVRMLAKHFKCVPVLFDDDPQAIIQANKLVGDLKFRGVDSFRVDITGDPGGMKQSEADYLVKQLIK